MRRTTTEGTESVAAAILMGEFVGGDGGHLSATSGTTAPPSVPSPQTRVSLLLWVVPFLLVALYLGVVHTYYAHDARWAGIDLPRISAELLGLTAAFSALWFVVAYLASVFLGEWVPVAIGRLFGLFPQLGRKVVVMPPQRADTRREVWGRFAVLLLIAIGFELIFIVLIERRGDLDLHLAAYEPIRFVWDELTVGILLALTLGPAAPFIAARLRVRIVDSLPFPYLWLGLCLLAIGGTSIALVAVLPGVRLDPSLFAVSLLLYLPAAWLVALAFSRSETRAQNRFLRRVWALRSNSLRVGKIQIVDEPEGTIHDA